MTARADLRQPLKRTGESSPGTVGTTDPIRLIPVMFTILKFSISFWNQTKEAYTHGINPFALFPRMITILADLLRGALLMIKNLVGTSHHTFPTFLTFLRRCAFFRKDHRSIRAGFHAFPASVTFLFIYFIYSSQGLFNCFLRAGFCAFSTLPTACHFERISILLNFYGSQIRIFRSKQILRTKFHTFPASITAFFIYFWHRHLISFLI